LVAECPHLCTPKGFRRASLDAGCLLLNSLISELLHLKDSPIRRHAHKQRCQRSLKLHGVKHPITVPVEVRDQQLGKLPGLKLSSERLCLVCVADGSLILALLPLCNLRFRGSLD
jgi:hypothetical protein